MVGITMNRACYRRLSSVKFYSLNYYIALPPSSDQWSDCLIYIHICNYINTSSSRIFPWKQARISIIYILR